MSEKLKPCPFCGGDAMVVEERRPAGTVWQVGCSDRLCYAYYGKGYLYDTRAMAERSWNRRAERTSRYVYDREICAWRCSECGGLEPVGDHVRYCPDCGARIEEEVRDAD